MEQNFDVLIVGGGPSGLAAALVLGRCLRQVAIVDDGHPRNEASVVFNGFLSRDGSPPGEFLSICREQLRRYETVEFRRGFVESIVRSDDGFIATLKSGEALNSRFVLLATGVVDELPEIEGIRRFYGTAVHHCPYCHGWESRGEPTAVIGNDKASVELALELLIWSKDIVLCTNGPLRADRKRLDSQQVRMIETPVARLEGDGKKLTAVRFQNGEMLPRTTLYFSPAQKLSSLGKELGCASDEDDSIQCDENGKTSVPGVYVVGNASPGLQLVIVAAAKGTTAAVAINNALVDADAKNGTTP
jgi:thioredoxin reductase